MIRKIGAALAGLGVVGVVVFALQSLGASFHHPVVLVVAWTILGRRAPSTGAAEAS